MSTGGRPSARKKPRDLWRQPGMTRLFLVDGTLIEAGTDVRIEINGRLDGVSVFRYADREPVSMTFFPMARVDSVDWVPST